MRGGPRGVRDTLERGRGERMHFAEFAVVAAIILFGLVVPALVLMGDQASAGPGGEKLSTTQTEGRELFFERCATCHTLEDAGAVGRVGPNLDILAPAPGLTVNAIEEGRARGTGPDARAAARRRRGQARGRLHRRSRRALDRRAGRAPCGRRTSRSPGVAPSGGGVLSRSDASPSANCISRCESLGAAEGRFGVGRARADIALRVLTAPRAGVYDGAFAFWRARHADPPRGRPRPASDAFARDRCGSAARRAPSGPSQANPQTARSVRGLHNTAHMQGNRAVLRCRRQHAEFFGSGGPRERGNHSLGRIARCLA